MGEVGEYCKICGGAHPTGACQEVVTKTGLTREEMAKGVKTEDGEKIYWLNLGSIEKIKNLPTHLQIKFLEGQGIPENALFDTDEGDERVRYRWDKSGLHELKREKIKFGNQ